MSLESKIGNTFVKQRHGITTKVILKDVRRNKVMLQCPDRKDAFKLSIDEFNRYYQPEEHTR